MGKKFLEPPRHFTLNNGMSVVIQDMPGKNSILIELFVKIGFSNEKLKSNWGYTHFVEHMCFKGTKRRSQKKLNLEADSMGGEFDAYTDREYTSFQINSHSKHYKQALDIISDIFYNSSFDPEEFSKEKGPIKEEIKMRYDNHDMRMYDLFSYNFFPENHGPSPIGSEEHISSIKRDSLYKFYKDNYIPSNSILTISGNTSKIKESDIKNYFEDYSEPKNILYHNSQFKLNKKKLIVDQDNSEQGKFYIVFPGMRYTDDNIASLLLFDDLMAGGMSSRLFQLLREEKGLCYSIYSVESSLKESGFWLIGGACSYDNIEKCVNTSIKEVKETLNGKLTKKEFEAIKNKFVTGLELSFESSSHFNDVNFESLFYREKLVDYYYLVNKIKDLKYQDCLQHMNDLWKDVDVPNVQLLGNFGKKFSMKVSKIR